MPPFLIDNETYYIQSIQWLNQFGYTKGVANLHPLLGQMSAWHVLEAGLNLQWNGSTTNDLNGFLYFVVVGYALKSAFSLRAFSLPLLIIAPFFLIFVSSPSPDLPVLLCVSFITTAVLEHKYNKQKERIFIALIIAMLFLIKVTIAPLLGMLFFLPFKKRDGYVIGTFALATSVIWILKNYIISGWLFYPFPWWQVNQKWSLPIEYYRFENAVAKPVLSQMEDVLLLIVLIGVLYALIYYLIQKCKVKQALIVLAVSQIFIVWITNASLRLALPGVLIVIIVAGSFLGLQSDHVKQTRAMLSAGAISLLMVGWLNMRKVDSRKTKMYHGGKSITYHHFLNPAKNTRFDTMTFKKYSEGNLDYYSPQQDILLYNTFAAPLPAINKRQVHFFKSRFRIVPQKIGNQFEDGFYSKRITD